MESINLGGDPLALDRQVCFALSVASRNVISLYRPLLTPLGLTHPQYLVMLALWEESPRSVKELCTNLEHAAETLRFNPRRLLMRGSASFSGYRYTVRALSRAVDQLHALMRSLTFIAGGEADPDREQFLRSFADALDSVAGAARLFGDIHSVQDLKQEGNELQQCINNARSATREIGGYLSSERLEEPGSWPAYEALHADSRRLVEDIARAEHDLAQLG